MIQERNKNSKREKKRKDNVAVLQNADALGCMKVYSDAILQDRKNAGKVAGFIPTKLTLIHSEEETNDAFYPF